MPSCVGCSQEIPVTAAFCPRCGTPNPEARTPRTPAGEETGERATTEEVRRRLQAALGADYTIQHELGEGGFALVFAVQDHRLSRRIAVKVLRPELTASGSSVQRFVREAESAAKLTHPCILPIFFVGGGHGLVYFGMPLVEGETLDEVIHGEGQLGETEAARIGAEIAEALSEAHAQGLIHRDVKPSNVLLQGAKRRVLVTDFGIAKAATTKGMLTGTGVVIGSPHYMSPEQASGSREIDHRSDIYSLGVVLWQMLAGKVPFDAPNSQGVLLQHLTKPLPPLESRRPGVSPALAAVVSRCCAKLPEQRYQSAAGVAEALRAAIAAPRPRPSRRTVWMAGAGVALALGAIGLATLVLGRGDRQRDIGGPSADTARSAAPMLAVLPFKVPENATVDGPSVAQLLANAVVGAFEVSTVDMNRLLGRWTTEERSVDAPLEDNAAFAYAMGANQLAVGRSFQAGPLVRLTVDVYDVQTLARLGHSERTGHPDSLFALVDGLAANVAGTFCRQPEFNPGNLCFDVAPAPRESLRVGYTATGGAARPEPPAFYVFVSADGRLADVRIKRAPDVPEIVAGALSVVRAARYRPASKAGRLVEAWTAVTVGLQSASEAEALAAASVSEGCDRQAESLANPGRRCYDTRPIPRTAPLAPVPPTCPGAVGPATVVVQVSASGAVLGSPVVARSSGCREFDALAAAFVAQAEFAPARKGAGAVSAWTQLLVQPETLQ